MSNGKPAYSSGNDQPAKSVRDTGGAGDPLLDAIVQETLAGKDPLAEEELADLRAVAARYPGAELTLEPIGVEIIERLLQRRLPAVKPSTHLSRQMAETIAQTLFDHPETRSRLDDLWRQVCEPVEP
ncbi:MAG: hypothetical protein KDA92_02755 [Planctomycetales bacterium]|nr:hypothetical protein [Planctomycetales bacterium]MCA9170445.1 hypothetical protein [Planctomycetales bacterium]